MSFVKGWFGEKITQLGLWIYLDKAIYKRLHGVILETSNGTTEIDHVYLSRFGIFVLETKNYEGWIFGDKDRKEWTQSLPGGRKHKFQNPLHQNHKHTKAISEKLAVNHALVHSIVVFVGDTVDFKTDMPSNVVKRPYRAAQYIKTFEEIVFTDEQLWHFENELYGLKTTQVSRGEHIRNLKNRYAQTDICPKCGSALVEKVATQGKNEGNTFIACSSYPKCTYISKNAAASPTKINQAAEREPEYSVKDSQAPTNACPKCGSPLVERVAAKGKNKGNKFIACSGYPKCRYADYNTAALPK